MNELFEAIKLTGGVAGAILSIVALITMVCKPVRQWIVDKVKDFSGTSTIEHDLSSRIDKQGEMLNEIKDMLEKHIEANAKFKAQVIADNAALKEGVTQSLGNIIKNTYNEYRADKRIPEHEYESLCRIYKVYHDTFGGNGPIEKIYVEISTTWEIEF